MIPPSKGLPGASIGLFFAHSGFGGIANRIKPKNGYAGGHLFADFKEPAGLLPHKQGKGFWFFGRVFHDSGASPAHKAFLFRPVAAGGIGRNQGQCPINFHKNPVVFSQAIPFVSPIGTVGIKNQAAVFPAVTGMQRNHIRKFFVKQPEMQISCPLQNGFNPMGVGDFPFFSSYNKKLLF